MNNMKIDQEEAGFAWIEVHSCDTCPNLELIEGEKLYKCTRVKDVVFKVTPVRMTDDRSDEFICHQHGWRVH